MKRIYQLEIGPKSAKRLAYQAIIISSHFKKKANHLFKIHADNPLGFYSDPIAKIKFVVQRNIEKTHASKFEDLRLKISCDGLQLTKTHRTVLNVTFTLINERKSLYE